MKDAKYIPALGYDILTPLYDAVARLTVRENKFKKALISQANFMDGQRVLDLACGTGTLALLIKETYPKVEVTGIDGDANVLEIAAGKTAQKGAEIRFDEGLSFSLPYLDESFDCVVSSLFFHHLTRDNKLRTLSEISRVLKPEGEFHLADWGLPANFLMYLASQGVKFLDGAETTNDNFKGLLPSLIDETGFRETKETGYFNSLFGTIRLLKTQK